MPGCWRSRGPQSRRRRPGPCPPRTFSPVVGPPVRPDSPPRFSKIARPSTSQPVRTRDAHSLPRCQPVRLPSMTEQQPSVRRGGPGHEARLSSLGRRRPPRAKADPAGAVGRGSSAPGSGLLHPAAPGSKEASPPGDVAGSLPVAADDRGSQFFLFTLLLQEGRCRRHGALLVGAIVPAHLDLPVNKDYAHVTRAGYSTAYSTEWQKLSLASVNG